MPALVGYGGYQIYRKNVAEAEERAQRLKATEEKFLSNSNIVKLQNFNKKVFAIGVFDDILDDPEFAKTQGDEWKIKIATNAALIRNFIKELQAENVVLEMCEERYNDEVYEIVSHPNYDRTFSRVHKLLDKKPERLLKFDQIALDQGNFELLVGLDTCSYRTPCKTIFGDRNFSLTQKRYQAKLNLLQLYKEQVAQTTQSKLVTPQTSIFDLANSQSDNSEIDKLKQAIKQTSQKNIGIEFIQDKVGLELNELVLRESKKTEHDVYTEVFIDEVDQELLNSVQKAEGQVIVMLVRMERLKSFSKLWRSANLDFYNTQTSVSQKLKKQTEKIQSE